MAEPISLEDAKAQLRILSDDEDDVVMAAITDARGWIEDYTGLILTRRAVTEVIADFGHDLSTWPIVSIDSVDYTDTDGLDHVLVDTNYFAQIARRPARLVARAWPRMMSGSTIAVTMTAGFASPEAIQLFSPNIMRAMRILTAGFFNDRETGGLAGDLETAAKRLCRSMKRWGI
ncbi:head-tail connector protein [Sphingobium lactosutens]|uniref:Uncharacterized protein n=1 Tax=Sphingobium lactosutens DS20 TaxID=1331060 RepID=T0HM42_9SPHN|nr:phage head-tail connector protein [Sphingobium lactosutens]EQB13243.1 hypothetical protein RLDS_15995 [Sphingobium lactosutens DS20]